jgi:hypothetical protein
VLVVENAAKESVSLTANEIQGSATSKLKTPTSVTVAGIKYVGFKVSGAPSTVQMNECDYLFRANGTVKLECPAGKEIVITATETGCTYKFPTQEPTAGITYTNIGKEATTTTEITASPNVTKISGTVGPGCPIAAGAFTLGRYTTGSTKVTVETDDGSAQL